MALIATEKVLTLDYWKPAYKLEVGDYVFDRNGKPVKITLIQQYRAEDCYKVIFAGGMSVCGDGNLGFPLETEKYRKRIREYKGVFKFRRPMKYYKIKELLHMPMREKRDNRRSFSIATTHPVALPTQDLPVPAFIFGFWYMNRKANGHMVFPKGQEEFITEKFKSYGYKVIPGRRSGNGERRFHTSPTIASQLRDPNPSRIPNNYLLASPEQRIEFLSGYIYGKYRQRYIIEKDLFRLSANDYREAIALLGLLESLGCKPYLEYVHYKRQKRYKVFFKTFHRLVENQVSPPVKVHHGRRYLHHIKPIEPQLCVHIETDGEDKSILVGEGYLTCL